MTPTSNAPVRWHAAPTPRPPEPQSMQEPAPPPPQQPDLTQLRQRLTAAQEETAVLWDRRTEAEAAALRLSGPGSAGPDMCASMAFVGAGMVALAALGSLPLYMRVCMGVIGGGSGSTGLAGTLICCGGRRRDQQTVAHNVSDEDLASARQRQQDLQRQYSEAEAVDIMVNFNAIVGRDVALLALAYAEPLPGAEAAEPT